MKIRISKLMSNRVVKRFKIMCLVTLAMTALNYIFDGSYETMDMIKFVDAGEDQTFEQDEIYSGYIKSAKLQRELMT